MTFSDSRIAEALTRDWIPVWESVSPVKEVTFDLGEGREVRGTVGGEIAIYFCDEKGKVFDILPALQSPAATLEAMQEALKFYKSQGGMIGQKAVRSYHLREMRSFLETVEVPPASREDLYSPDLVTGGIELGFSLSPEEEATVEEMRRLPARRLFPETATGEADRENKISEAPDEATRDLRIMSESKAFANPRSEGKITIVEPGGRGYYRWQVRRAFCGIPPEGSVREWDASLKSPKGWQRLLFEEILHQPLGGGKFKYDTESLEALSIIED